MKKFVAVVIDEAQRKGQGGEVIGVMLSALRWYYNFDQKELAKEIGVSENYVRKLERGEAVDDENDWHEFEKLCEWAFAQN